MPGKTLNIEQILNPDNLATQIANRYSEWDMYRSSWIDSTKEIREYLFSTDTRTTSNATLPWKNSTTIPKLCQIRDNLHANYIAALYPNDTPWSWEGDDLSSEEKRKRRTIEAYVANKARMSDFNTEISRCLLDYIDYGNCFALVEYVEEFSEDPVTGEKIAGYSGPKLKRISPLDIVFNPIAPSFSETPKIIRTLTTLGSLKHDIETRPEMKYLEEVFNKSVATRAQFGSFAQSDVAKSSNLQIAGVGSLWQYMNSDYVEILDFYGDIYNEHTQELERNKLITVIDRSYVIRNISNPSWLGSNNIYHAGWRLKPDSLYAMGPLDNLVGMQYRIDHLENAKADAMDLIIHPVMKVRGMVEDFDYAPGERIFVGDEGDVEFMRPDWSVLNVDTQIAMYEAKMEEMAGAPKQAMGFRTPGEKTAYEVQVLENGANRIFLNKTAEFERTFLEPILNSMLEVGRRNIGTSEMIKVFDDEYKVVEFLKITKEDISAKGRIRPIGARRFARNANMILNITQLWSSPVMQDPSISVHISGVKTAKLLEELLGLSRFELVQENIKIAEQLETSRLTQEAQQLVMEEGMPQDEVPVVQ